MVGEVYSFSEQFLIVKMTTAFIFETGKIDNETSALKLKYDSSNHACQTLKRLDAMRRERQLCDVILMIEGHEFFAHRALLSCYSNCFFDLFLNDENDTLTRKPVYYQVAGIEHEALKLILQFIYCGR